MASILSATSIIEKKGFKPTFGATKHITENVEKINGDNADKDPKEKAPQKDKGKEKVVENLKKKKMHIFSSSVG